MWCKTLKVMMYNLGVEFSNSCCQVFWPSVPGQQGVHCLAQAGQEGVRLYDSVNISIALSCGGTIVFFAGDGAAGGSQDVPTAPSFPGQVLS